MKGWEPRIETLEREVAGARGLWDVDEIELAKLERNLNEALDEKSLAEWQCRLHFPTVRHVLPPRRSDPGCKTNSQSPLRRELNFEDLAELGEDGQVGNEVAEAQDGDGVLYTTFWDFFADRYMWMGPRIEWSAEEDESTVDTQDEYPSEGQDDVQAGPIDGSRTLPWDHGGQPAETKRLANQSCHERTLGDLTANMSLVVVGSE
jgi:hypothetical protein